jgi:predicted SAM-dependent methyltransferase
MTETVRVNVGCGQSPTEGWRNFDNSPSLYLSKIPLLPPLLLKMRLISHQQATFIRFCRKHSIEHANATKRLPLKSGSAEVLYSSHMIEHLDHEEVKLFLSEARRVLCAGGIIRLAVPDIRMRIDRYNANHDADAFIQSTNMSRPRPRTFSKRVGILLVGPRQHHWMYDGESLSRLLLLHGFTSPRILRAGETQISHPEDLNLYERAEESVYVEAMNP